MSKNCKFSYKGNTYTEEDIKPIASYHYMLQDKVLQTGDFEEIGNTIQAKFVSEEVPNINPNKTLQQINNDYALGQQVVTIDNNGIVDIDVTPIVSDILNKEEGLVENSTPYLRKAYNLEGTDEETMEAFNDKAALMEKRFSELGITTHIILDGDINESGQLLGTGSERYKELVASGEISKGDAVVVVNPRKLFTDTVFHEYGHLFIDLLGGMNNPRIKYAYAKIKNSPLALQVMQNYSELSGDELAKEVMATAIGKEATDIYNGVGEDLNFIQKFLEWLRDSISKLLGINTTDVKKLAQELLGDSFEDQFTGKLSAYSQLYKDIKWTKKTDNIIRGAQISKEKIVRRANNILATISRSTQKETVRFKNQLESIKADIQMLSPKSNLLAVRKFIETTNEISETIVDYLTTLQEETDKEKLQLSFVMLQKTDLFEDLFDLVDDVRENILSGYFQKEFAENGWDDATTQDFISKVDSLKSNYSKIQELKINLGRHHIANKLVPYSNRMVVNRRIELEQEFKSTNPKQSGETSAKYNARIREMVDKQVKEELPELKKREREWIFNRLKESPTDIGAFALWVSSEKDLNSMMIQLASKLLDESDLKRDQFVIKKRLEAYEIFQQFDKETTGQSPQEKYKGFYQEGSDGLLYIAGEYDVEWFIQRNKLIKDYFDAVEEFGEQSDAAKQANKRKKDWDAKNTIIQTGTQTRIPTDKWKNKSYEAIISNPESGKAKMLKFLVDTSIENSKLLHGNQSLVLNSTQSNVNFIRVPSVGRSLFEKVTGGNYKNGVQDWLERQVKAKTDDTEFTGEISDEMRVLGNSQGNIKHGVPIHFRGKIPLNEISYDLMSSVMMDNYMASNYHHKTGIQIELELMRDIAANKKIDRTYGVGKKILYNALNQKELEKIEQMAGKDSREFIKLQSLIENRLYGIKTTNTEYAKIASSLMSWTAQSMLIFNLPSGVANLLQGKVFNFIESVGGEYFKGSDLKAAESLFFADMKNWMDDIGRPVSKSKTKQLMDLFNIQGEFKAISSKFIENDRFKALAKTNSGFAFNHMGEFYMHGTLMYAILNNIKMLNVNGEYIDKNGNVTTKEKAMSLVEAIEVDDKGNMKMNKHGYKTSFGNSTFSLNFNKDKGALEVRNLINKIAHDLHGNYNEEIQSHGQRYVIGKMISMFRKWIVPGFNRRWRGAVNINKKISELDSEVDGFYSEDMQAYQEGFYTTLFRFLNQVKQNFKQLGFEAISSEWDKLSDREIANIRRAGIELGIITFSFFASLALLALAGDLDDPLEKEIAFHLTYFTRRTFSELAFFANPIEAFKIMRDPSATLSYVSKMGRFTQQLMEDITYNIPSGEGLEKYQVGRNKGRVKLWVRTADLIPGANQYFRDIEESTSWMFNIY